MTAYWKPANAAVLGKFRFLFSVHLYVVLCLTAGQWSGTITRLPLQGPPTGIEADLT